MELPTTLLAGASSAGGSSGVTTPGRHPAGELIGGAETGERRPRRSTVRSIRARKGTGDRIVMVTAYDTPSARIVDRSGADIILVGDSLGMVVLGYEDTLKVDMEDMVRHTAAARRADPRGLLIADMPFLSYQVSVEQAVINAGRLIRDGGADGVKLEGGRAMLPVVEAIVRASIPVMGHVGLTPQSVKRFGGYRVQGRGEDASRAVLEDTRALEDAGVFAVVLEGIPQELGKRITEAVTVPTIGIGAGPGTDGQVLVLHDLVGLTEGRLPRFVKRYANLAAHMEEAVAAFVGDVRRGEYPGPAHCYD